MTTAGERDYVSGDELDPDSCLGNFIRKCRREKGLTLARVSEEAKLSNGALSRIENGLTSSNLRTLARLSEALDVPLSRMLSNYERPPVEEAQLVKAGQGMEVVRRGTKKGHTYHLLAYDRGSSQDGGPSQVFEPFLITVTNESEVFPLFEHAGVEFIYMLEGKIEYCHGQFTYLLEPGDSLAFRGEVAHGPERLVEIPSRFLAIINYNTRGDDEGGDIEDRKRRGRREILEGHHAWEPVSFSEMIRALS